MQLILKYLIFSLLIILQTQVTAQTLPLTPEMKAMIGKEFFIRKEKINYIIKQGDEESFGVVPDIKNYIFYQTIRNNKNTTFEDRICTDMIYEGSYYSEVDYRDPTAFYSYWYFPDNYVCGLAINQITGEKILLSMKYRQYSKTIKIIDVLNIEKGYYLRPLSIVNKVPKNKFDTLIEFDHPKYINYEHYSIVNVEKTCKEKNYNNVKYIQIYDNKIKISSNTGKIKPALIQSKNHYFRPVILPEDCK